MGQVAESRQYKIMDSEIKLLAVFSDLFTRLFPSLLHHEGARLWWTVRWHRPPRVPWPPRQGRLETLML